MIHIIIYDQYYEILSELKMGNLLKLVITLQKTLFMSLQFQLNWRCLSDLAVRAVFNWKLEGLVSILLFMSCHYTF